MSIITLASVQVLRSLVGGVLTLRVRLCSSLTLERHQTPPGEQHQQHAGPLQQPLHNIDPTDTFVNEISRIFIIFGLCWKILLALTYL